MKKIFKICLLILIFIIILSFTFYKIDYYRAQNNKTPLFAINTIIYKDGGSKEYYGLFYKFIKCNPLSGDKSSHIGFYNMNINNLCNLKTDYLDEVKDQAFTYNHLIIKDYIKEITLPDYKIRTYGINNLKIKIDNNIYPLFDALNENKTTIDKIISDLEYDTTICYCNGEQIVSEDKTTTYISETYNISLLDCNNSTYYITDPKYTFEENLCQKK